MVKIKLNTFIVALAMLIHPTWSACDVAVDFQETPDKLDLGASNCNKFVAKKIEVALRSARAYADNPTGAFLADICSKSYFYPGPKYCSNVNRNQPNKTLEEIFDLYDEERGHSISKNFANGRGNAKGSGQGNGLAINPHCASRRFLREADEKAETEMTNNHHRRLAECGICGSCYAAGCPNAFSECGDCDACHEYCPYRRRLDELDMVFENERLQSELFIRRLTNIPQDDGPCGQPYVQDFCDEFTRFASGEEYNITQVQDVNMIITIIQENPVTTSKFGVKYIGNIIKQTIDNKVVRSCSVGSGTVI